QHSYFSDKAAGVICGFGADSYRYAMDAALTRLAATTA
ncbi:type II 3-dehydroquinate dehydratase, partial [Stenotrophomonas sp.]